MFVWIDEDPDIAFERAALLFDVAEITWDMTRILWNGAVDVMNAGVIPLWNTATYYLVEPTITLVLEVFSLIFMRQHWQGVMTEGDFPYNGLDCTASAESAAWCGRYSFYKAELEAPERAPVFADESQSFARRMMLEVPANLTFTFGLATARRLQEQSGGEFAAPSFSTGSLTTALNELSVFFITMVPSLLDVVFGVLGDIIKTSFSVLMDALFMVLKSVMMVLKMLLKSGMLTTIVTIGVDFVLIVTRGNPNPCARLRPLTATRHACAVTHRDRAPPALCGHRRAHVHPGLLQAEQLERPAGVRPPRLRDPPSRSPRAHPSPPVRAQVRREHVLQGARRRRRPARLLLAAHRHRPLHGHHGRDAQLAHGQALLQGAQVGRLEQQGAHARPDFGENGGQQRARKRGHGQPHVRV